MATNSPIQIGILSPATPNRPHFKSLDGILPPGVSIAHEGLGLLGESYQDLAGKEDVIVARVRSRLGRVTLHAHAIEVKLKEGNEIQLKGPALASEHDRIVRAAARVRGVDHIDDDLVVYEDADGVPG